MKNFALGFLTAAVLFGGYLVWQARRPAGSAAVSLAPDAGAPVPEKRRRRRGGGGAGAGAGAGAAASVQLHPGDLRPVSEGDDLKTPDVIDLTERGGPEGELPQEEVDARLHAHQPELLACIDKARPDPDAPIVGQVVVKFRVTRSGQVRGVRVEAPAILMRNGLFRCIRPIVAAFRFSASGGSSVMTYPFKLE